MVPVGVLCTCCATQNGQWHSGRVSSHRSLSQTCISTSGCHRRPSLPITRRRLSPLLPRTGAPEAIKTRQDGRAWQRYSVALEKDAKGLLSDVTVTLFFVFIFTFLCLVSSFSLRNLHICSPPYWTLSSLPAIGLSNRALSM